MEKVSNCGGEPLEKYVTTTAINPITSGFDDFSQLTGDESYSNLFDGWKARREEKRAQKAEKRAAKTEIKKARASKITAKGEAAKTKADAKLAGAQAEQASASQEGVVAQAVAGAPEDGNKKIMIIGGVVVGLLVIGGIFMAMRKPATA